MSKYCHYCISLSLVSVSALLLVSVLLLVLVLVYSCSGFHCSSAHFYSTLFYRNYCFFLGRHCFCWNLQWRWVFFFKIYVVRDIGFSSCFIWLLEKDQRKEVTAQQIIIDSHCGDIGRAEFFAQNLCLYGPKDTVVK